MPNVYPEQTEDHSNTLRKVLALKALREYMYAQHPGKYGATDFLEDIPGARVYAQGATDVLPSLATISHDPNQRHEQIQAAIQRMREASDESKPHNRWKESGKAALNMAKGSVIPSALFAALLSRGVFKGKPMGTMFGKTIKRPTINRELFRNPISRARYLEDFRNNTAMGVGSGAFIGALGPALNGGVKFNDQELQQAADIMQNNPYITTLPGQDIAQVIKEQTHKPSLTRDTAIGAATGAGIGLAGNAAAAAFNVPWKGIPAMIKRKPFPTRAIMSPMRQTGMVSGGAILGGGSVLVSGLVSKYLERQDRKKQEAATAQQSPSAWYQYPTTKSKF